MNAAPTNTTAPPTENMIGYTSVNFIDIYRAAEVTNGTVNSIKNSLLGVNRFLILSP